MKGDATSDREFALVVPLLLVVILGVVLVAEIGVARLALEARGGGSGAHRIADDDDELVRSTVARRRRAARCGQRLKVIIERRERESPIVRRSGSLLRVRLRYAIAIPLDSSAFLRLIVEGAAARRVEWTP